MARDQEQSRGERQGGRSPRGGSTQGGAGVRASHRTAAVLPAPSAAVTCRFDPLAHQAGADIKAPRGNRAQWHANFQLDEFVDTSRDVPVMHESESGLQLRGMLIIGPGHTLADAYHMLRTELQIEPERGAYMVLVVGDELELLLASAGDAHTIAFDLVVDDENWRGNADAG